MRWVGGARRRLLRAVLSGALAAAAASVAAQEIPPEAAGWSALERGRLTVYHEPRQAALARRVAEILEAQPPLPGLPAEVPSGVSAFLPANEATFVGLTGGRVPEWSAGVAIPSRGFLIVPAYTSWRGAAGDRARVLRHEWAHLGLHEYLDGLRIPRWFDEGYAEWVAGWDASEAWRLRVLLAAGRAPPLDSLALEWPRDAASARMAYLLSATAVEYLVRESGEHGLQLLLERWRSSGDFEAALLGTYGVTPGQLEVHWRRYVRQRYGWLLVLSHSVAFWLILAGLLVLLLGTRRRRDRERLARLRADEVPEAPAYWSEDEERPSGPPPGSAG